MTRIRTYAEGLDDALGGGVPERSVVLLVGAPGTMKSSLAYAILHANAVRGVRGLYVSLEQSRDSLLDHVEGMGFDPAAVKKTLSILDLATLRRKMGTTGSWMELFRMYTQSIRAGFPYELLALDSLDALEVLAQFRDYRAETFQLFRWLRGLGCTSIVLGELIPGTANPAAFGKHREEYLADGIVHLSQEKRGEFEVQRRLRIVKMRGARHDTAYKALVFDRGFRVTEILS